VALDGWLAAGNNSGVHAVGYLAGFALLAAGVLGVVVPLVPGSLLLVLGTVTLALSDSFRRVGWGTVVFSAVLAASISAVDLAAAALGTKVAKVSRSAVLGASVGFVVGLFFGLPGILFGPAAGAMLFEYARDPRFRQALRAGTFAFLGLVAGSVVKVALALVLVGVVVLRLAL
jgi:uncharacterized protein YqgC (DUF456 family)